MADDSQGSHTSVPVFDQHTWTHTPHQLRLKEYDITALGFNTPINDELVLKPSWLKTLLHFLLLV